MRKYGVPSIIHIGLTKWRSFNLCVVSSLLNSIFHLGCFICLHLLSLELLMFVSELASSLLFVLKRRKGDSYDLFIHNSNDLSLGEWKPWVNHTTRLVAKRIWALITPITTTLKSNAFFFLLFLSLLRFLLSFSQFLYHLLSSSFPPLFLGLFQFSSYFFYSRFSSKFNLNFP